MRLIPYRVHPIASIGPRLPRFWAVESKGGARAGSRPSFPAVDVFEDENQIRIKADLPDMDEKDLKVEVYEGVLTVEGERKFETEDKRDGFRRLERRYGSFARSFALPSSADPDKIHASYDRGVLTVEIPKREESKTRPVRIEVVNN